MKKLRISEIAKKYNRSRVAVLNWIKDGLLPGAVLNDQGLIPYWEIPESDLKNFKIPESGRPRTKHKGEKIAA